MKIKLTAAEVQTLMQHVEGQGGWQSLFRRLQSGCNPTTGEITLSAGDVEKLREYCNEYGDGGWQGRLRQIFQRTLESDSKLSRVISCSCDTACEELD